MIRSIAAAALAAVLVVGSAGAAFACKEVRAPEAAACVWRDPVAVVILDNRPSNVPVTLRVIWSNWKTGVRQTKDFALAAGDIKLKQIRVKGGDRKLAVVDLGTREVLLRERVVDLRQPRCPTVA